VQEAAETTAAAAAAVHSAYRELDSLYGDSS